MIIPLEGIVEEVTDVIALGGARRPMAIGFKGDEIRRFITLAGGGGPVADAADEPPHPILVP